MPWPTSECWRSSSWPSGVPRAMPACALVSCLQQIIPTTSTHDRLRPAPDPSVRPADDRSGKTSRRLPGARLRRQTNDTELAAWIDRIRPVSPRRGRSDCRTDLVRLYGCPPDVQFGRVPAVVCAAAVSGSLAAEPAAPGPCCFRPGAEHFGQLRHQYELAILCW